MTPYGGIDNYIRDLEAELTALRAEKERLKNSIPSFPADDPRNNIRLKNLIAENERLEKRVAELETENEGLCKIVIDTNEDYNNVCALNSASSHVAAKYIAKSESMQAVVDAAIDAADEFEGIEKNHRINEHQFDRAVDLVNAVSEYAALESLDAG